MADEGIYPIGAHRRWIVVPLGFSMRNGDRWAILYQRRERRFPHVWRHQWVTCDEPITCRTRDEAIRAAQDVSQSPAVRQMLKVCDRGGDRLPQEG